MDSGSPASRANFSASMMSAVPEQRATAAGRLSIAAFQIVRACS
jgi:hypothetical protein